MSWLKHRKESVASPQSIKSFPIVTGAKVTCSPTWQNGPNILPRKLLYPSETLRTHIQTLHSEKKLCGMIISLSQLVIWLLHSLSFCHRIPKSGINTLPPLHIFSRWPCAQSLDDVQCCPSGSGTAGWSRWHPGHLRSPPSGSPPTRTSLRSKKRHRFLGQRKLFLLVFVFFCFFVCVLCWSLFYAYKCHNKHRVLQCHPCACTYPYVPCWR